MDLYTFLIIGHVIGTVLGVGGATFSEIFYLKALKDGKMDPVESGFLKTTYTVLRIGMIFVVLSGFGMLLWLNFVGNESALFEPKIWAKMTVTIVILINALLLQTRSIPIWLASSLSFTSWYTALILGLWRGISYSYIEIMLGYIVAVLVVAWILEKIKKLYFARGKNQKSK